jgi:hypothetical protein
MWLASSVPFALEEILSFATKKSMTTSLKWLYVWHW